MRRCKATNARGEPCGAPALHGSDWCFWHDPALAKERAAARRKAGKNRRRGAADPSFAEAMESREFRTLEDIVGLLGVTIRQTLALENSVSRNRALGYLSRCWADVYRVGEIERRVEVLEARDDARTRATG